MALKMKLYNPNTNNKEMNMVTKRFLIAPMLAAVMIACLFAVSPAAQDTQTAKPLTQVIVRGPGAVASSGAIQLPVITWGGDVAAVYAADAGFFKAENLNVSLFLENNFPKQVEACLSGRTPYLRGTMGMINAASEVFKKHGIELVVVCQLTWSTGGDALVVRKNVKNPQNLSGKTIALQLYGPHMDYIANILRSAGVSLSGVNFRWFQELTLPTFDTRGKTIDPVSAFLEDDAIDGVMCIIPDANALTSGGKVGTGASGSVKDARIMVSTRTASRIIADVYAVRSDYYNQNKTSVQSFVRALMKGQEELGGLLKKKKERQSEYNKLMSHSADLLLGAPQATPDIENLLADCTFVGFDGNVGFFTGQGTTRTLKTLTDEIQTSFAALGLMSGRVTIAKPDWDFDAMAKGIVSVSSKTEQPPVKQKFDTRKVQEKITVEPTSWAEEGTLFQIEINFGPNQSDFPEAQYAGDFQKALDTAQTYGGALIIIEGHSDPLGVMKAKQQGKPAVEISQMEQQAKNLSLSRSQAVRQSFIAYVNKRNIRLDESQFVAVGMGIAQPKYNPPRTQQEWNANRRVVFRIKQVEAELSQFTPLD